MRFFKSFNLLHRRTKSDPGGNSKLIDSTVTPAAALKHSSCQAYDAKPNIGISLFDLVVSRSPQIPSQFHHLSGSGDGLAFTHRPHPIQHISDLEKENARLKEDNQLWSAENTVLQQKLKDCRDRLYAELRKNVILQRMLDERESAMKNMSKYMASCERSTGISGTSVASREMQKSAGSSSRSGSMLALSVDGKGRTLDNYSMALKMTLVARKALRDQQKFTKFWKRQTLSVVQTGDLVTPSASAISSIHQVLPEDRQASLDALILQRQTTYPSRKYNQPIVLGQKPAALRSYTSISSIVPSLPSCPTNSSSGSRLAPLASDSLKAEVNLLFGVQVSEKPSPRKSLSSSFDNPLDARLLREFDKTTSIPSKGSGLNLNIDSFGDLSIIFETTFGSRLPPEPRYFPPVDDNFLKTLGDSTSTMLPTQSNLDKATTNHQQNRNLKLASEECSPRRSWQKYISRSPSPRLFLETKGGLRSKAGKGKENKFPISAFKPPSSRLLIPIFGREYISRE